MKKKLLALILAALMTVSLVPMSVLAEGAELMSGTRTGGTLSGSGDSVTDPIVIADADDWDAFASNVTDGSNSYSGKYLRLAADISVTTIAGTSSNPFSGHFDGCGHTLTVSYGSADAPLDESYVAPFRYVKNGTITRLHTDGYIYNTGSYDRNAGGIIGQVWKGSAVISSCRSSVKIIFVGNSYSRNGGVVGQYSTGTGGSLTITKTLFDGKILYSGDTSQCGGFVGETNASDSVPALSNCLYAPAAIETGEHEATSSACTFVNYNSYATNVVNCYYTRTLGTAQGIAVGERTPAQLCADLGSGWKVEDDKVVPVMSINDLGTADVSVNAPNSTYTYTGSAITVTPTVLDASNNTLTAGVDYNYSIADLSGAPVAEIVEKGTYTLNVSGIGNYTGSNSTTFRVDGDGSETNPFVINSSADWNAFADNLNSGTVNYSGKFLILTADITVNQLHLAGTSSHKFNGSFEGNGHTITLSPTGNLDDSHAGIFQNVENAAITNLHVDGTTGSTTGWYITGFIGNAYGTVNITNCRNSFRTTFAWNRKYLSGFIGYVPSDSSITFTNCLFDGMASIGTGSDCSSFAGFVGMCYGNVTFNNCYSNGVVKSGSPVATFANTESSGTVTLNNCWYKNNDGSSYTVWQGTDVGTKTNAEIAAELGSGWKLDDGGNVVPIMEKTLDTATITGVNAFYRYTGSEIAVACTVKNATGLTLAEGTDYTVSYTLNGSAVSAVNGKGDYVLTVNPAAGSAYTGSTSVSFKVGDAPETPANLMIDGDIDFDVDPVGYFCVNMPSDSTTTEVTVSAEAIAAGFVGFKVYDDGGKNGNYSRNANGLVHVNVPEGYAVVLSGSVDLYVDYGAYFYVYDSATTDYYQRIADYHNDVDLGELYSTGRNMLIRFESSEYSATGVGLDLSVRIIDVSSAKEITVAAAEHGSVTAPASAMANTDVALTVVPEAGYALDSITVTNTATGYTLLFENNLWYTGGSYTIKMPAVNATVTPAFTAISGAFYVNMPKTGTLTVTAPEGIPGFKLYDNGGASGKFSSGCEGYALITVPVGYHISLSGTVETGSDYDWLTVYDGSGDDAVKLAEKVQGASASVDVTGTGRTMLVYFQTSLHGDSAAGLDLTVTLVPNAYTVVFNANDGTGSPATASQGFTYGTVQALAECSFTREGYTFVGWNTASDSTGVTYADKATVNNLTDANNGSVTLYAMWRPDTAPYYSGCVVEERGSTTSDSVRNIHFKMRYLFNGHAYLQHRAVPEGSDGIYMIDGLGLSLTYTTAGGTYTSGWMSVTNVFHSDADGFEFTLLIKQIPTAYSATEFTVDSYIEYRSGETHIRVNGVPVSQSLDGIYGTN